MSYFAYNVGGFKKRAKCAYVIKIWPLSHFKAKIRLLSVFQSEK